MAVKNVSGHGVTTKAGGHNQQVLPGAPAFRQTPGFKNYQAPKGGKARPKVVR